MTCLDLRWEASVMNQGMTLLPQDQLICLQEETICISTTICYPNISMLVCVKNSPFLAAD